MKMRQMLTCVLVVGFGVTLVDAGSRVGRGAGRGAAMGAVFGLLLGGDIDTIQQASIEADRAILDVRQIRREEGISCVR